MPTAVDVDLSPPRTAAACPRCRAAVREGAPWCTQCYLALTPEQAPAAQPRTPEQGPAAQPPAPGPAPAAQPPAPALPQTATGDATWPCTACGQDNALAADACRACDAPFLGALRTAEGLVVPVLGVVRPADRARVLALACGLVLLVCLAVLVLGLVTG